MELKTEPLPYGTEHGLESVSSITIAIVVITFVAITIVTNAKKICPPPF